MARRPALRRRGTQLLTPTLFFSALACVAALAAGCREGRLPVCETNADCAERDAGKLGNVCYNLRCVECRYDSDCPAGQVCGVANTCDALQSPAATTDKDEERGWDPNNWDECAQRCKDAACISDCDHRFRK
uniref:Lipoprotein n=1 Tax=Racemicystis crocea TaxID=1707966 RepID=A0A3S7V0K1_9BACT|nr:hypothetical protein [Racemicystis crocea]